MKMKIKSHELLWLVLSLYLVVFFIFLTTVLVAVNRPSSGSGQLSEIPVLESGRINKIMTALDKRAKLEEGTKIDLVNVSFGKVEPFVNQTVGKEVNKVKSR